MLTYQWEEYETSSDPRSKKEKSNSKEQVKKKISLIKFIENNINIDNIVVSQ
jgi:hypothetical protein